jgi:hypothetical protein
LIGLKEMSFLAREVLMRSTKITTKMNNMKIIQFGISVLLLILLPAIGTILESTNALAADKKLPEFQVEVKKDSWDPDNFTPLWQSCKRNSIRTFGKESDRLEMKYHDEMSRQPKDEEIGLFAPETSKAFIEAGMILFPGSLPDDYPLRILAVKCGGEFCFMQLEIGRNADKRTWPTPKDWNGLKHAAEYWDICIGSSYRDTPPPVAKQLRECFVNMGLLKKKK